MLIVAELKSKAEREAEIDVIYELSKIAIPAAWRKYSKAW